MTEDNRKERNALNRLAALFVEDILNTSDDEILAEFKEKHGDPAQNAAAMRTLFEKTVIATSKQRLAAARAGVAAANTFKSSQPRLLATTMSITKMTADLITFVDEAGRRGPVRDLTSAGDNEVSVLCSLPIPVEHLDTVRALIAPLFDRFKAAAPVGAKLHFTDAFKEGNDSWRKVAEQVRYELFSMMHNHRIIVIYVARRAGLARTMYEHHETLRLDAKARTFSRIKIVGSNRPNDDRVEDYLMVGLALMLDTFAERENRKRVDILFDEIDATVAARYEKALEITRNVCRSRRTGRGFDPDKEEKLSRDIIIEAGASFPLDSRFLGKISVVGKDDPLIFAVDAVANSLWRHLSTLAPDAKLNDGASVARWSLGELVWAKDVHKDFDLI